MIEVMSIAAQGGVLFRRIATLPASATERRHPGRIVVAHSETGHHHAIDDLAVRLFDRQPLHPWICYLSVDGEFADVVHHRPYDTHQTLRLTRGVWEVRRQREWSFEQPHGQMVVD